MNAIDISTDVWLKRALMTLRFVGVAYIVLGVCMSVVFLSPLLLVSQGSSADRLGDEAIVNAAMAPVMLVFCIAFGVVNFVVASALAKRKGWAWFGALLLGLMYAPSICLPFGGILLYALLRPGVKDAYDVEAKRAAAPLA